MVFFPSPTQSGDPLTLTTTPELAPDSLHYHLAQLREQLVAGLTDDASLGSTLRRLDLLLRENNPRLLAQSIFHLAQSLEDGAGLPVAAHLYEVLEHSDSVSPAIQDQAHERRQILAGNGSGWGQWQHDARQLVSAPVSGFFLGTLAGMFIGSLAFRGVGHFIESRLASLALVEAERIGAGALGFWLRPRGILLASGLGGFAAELLGYTAVDRSVNYFLGNELDWTESGLTRELVGNALLLGPFHLARHGAASLVRRAVREQAVRERQVLFPFLSWNLSHQWMFLGNIFAQAMEDEMASHPRHSPEQVLWTGIFRLIQYNFSRAAVHGVLGNRWRATAWEIPSLAP